MVNPKTLKYKKKYNKRFTNKRKNNKFRHTKKIYKKKRHTTLKHKKIQRGGLGSVLATLPGMGEYADDEVARAASMAKSKNIVPSPHDTSTFDSTVKKQMLLKFKNDFTEQYPNKDIPSKIDDELKKYADGIMSLNNFQEKLSEKRKELFSQPTNTQNEQDTSKPTQDTSKPTQDTTESTYWFDWFSSYLSSLSTETLKQLREMINGIIGERSGGGGT
jgi:hypothetical protein